MTTLNPIIEQSDIESNNTRSTINDEEIKCCSRENITINCLAFFCAATLCFIFFLMLGGGVVFLTGN
jgi:hypothetical protein